ncbi:hypothetical protein SEA_PHEROBRINE_18 [Gordonia phage Pherobrine]|nr:hypothetical protein SEA_PHEROBRINE_18 [Gordonia phage Pherobrine]
MTDGVEDFLSHYGVKGMKWGKRKAQDALISRHNAGKGVKVSSDGSVRRNTNREQQAIKKANDVSKALETGVGKGLSRKEIKELNRVSKEAYDLKKTEETYNEAKEKGESVLVKSRAVGDYADTVMTGKQFADYVESGGVLNIQSTRIFARQAKEGEEFVLNNFEDEVYVPIKRK